jgi:hypothetical protein
LSALRKHMQCKMPYPLYPRKRTLHLHSIPHLNSHYWLAYFSLAVD